jgi:peptidoglycan/LPS O-acetylase OafA/YrhL
MPMAIILAELFFFQRYLNFSSKVTKFLSDAAYTVYLIHPLIVSAAQSHES